MAIVGDRSSPSTVRASAIVGFGSVGVMPLLPLTPVGATKTVAFGS